MAISSAILVKRLGIYAVQKIKCTKDGWIEYSPVIGTLFELANEFQDSLPCSTKVNTKSIDTLCKSLSRAFNKTSKQDEYIFRQVEMTDNLLNSYFCS